MGFSESLQDYKFPNLSSLMFIACETQNLLDLSTL